MHNIATQSVKLMGFGSYLMFPPASHKHATLTQRATVLALYNAKTAKLLLAITHTHTHTRVNVIAVQLIFIHSYPLITGCSPAEHSLLYVEDINHDQCSLTGYRL